MEKKTIADAIIYDKAGNTFIDVCNDLYDIELRYAV